jgi:hypothetical protein
MYLYLFFRKQIAVVVSLWAAGTKSAASGTETERSLGKWRELFSFQPEGPLAISLFEVLSFFGNESVPIGLLLAFQGTETGKQEFPDLTKDRIVKALNIPKRFALIKSTVGFLKVEPEIRKAVRDSIENKEATIGRAVEIFPRRLNRSLDPEQFLPLLHHARAVCKYALPYDQLLRRNPEFFFGVVRDLSLGGQAKEGLELAEELVPKFVNLLGNLNPNTLEIKRTKANAYYKLGRGEEAMEILKVFKWCFLSVL